MAPERGAVETDGERLRQAVARLQPSGRRGADLSAAERAVWEAVAAAFRAGQVAALEGLLAEARTEAEAAEHRFRRCLRGEDCPDAIEAERALVAEGVVAGIERAISAVVGAEGEGR